MKSLSSATPSAARNVLSRAWLTVSSPTIHRKASSERVRRTISRALPMPTEMAYSHSVSSIRTLVSGRPTCPSVAFAPAVNAARSSVSTIFHRRRARWSSAIASSGISKRMMPCPRNGSRVRAGVIGMCTSWLVGRFP